MALANALCSHSAQQSVFEMERDGVFTTVRSTCWSAAVVGTYRDAAPISWVEYPDHVLVNGCIKVKELKHVSLACVREHR